MKAPASTRGGLVKRQRGAAALDADGAEVTDLVLRSPGRYALVCFIANRDGKGGPHLLDGMLKEVEVR